MWKYLSRVVVRGKFLPAVNSSLALALIAKYFDDESLDRAFV